jgi:predicted nucleotidyltransferase
MNTNPDFKSIIEKIVEFSHPKAIYLFGSYAYGKPSENSDIDLCIIKNRIKDKLKTLRKIRLGLYDLPYPLDLILLSEKEFRNGKDIWWTIQGQINEKGKKIYEAI